MAIQLPVRNMAGHEVGTIELNEKVFGVKRNDTLIHQVIVAQQANKRQGTVNTKTRGDMKWGGAKPYRQKGTGRARQGSRTAPHYKGGGVVWGPHPRDYRQAIPRKMRRGALRSVLSAKLADNELIILDSLQFETPKTKEMVAVLRGLGVDNALIVLTESCTNARLSAENIERIETARADSLNVLEVLTRRYLIMPVEAVRMVEANLADDTRRLARRAVEAGVPGAEAARQPELALSLSGAATPAGAPATMAGPMADVAAGVANTAEGTAAAGPSGTASAFSATTGSTGGSSSAGAGERGTFSPTGVPDSGTSTGTGAGGAAPSTTGGSTGTEAEVEHLHGRRVSALEATGEADDEIDDAEEADIAAEADRPEERR